LSINKRYIRVLTSINEHIFSCLIQISTVLHRGNLLRLKFAFTCVFQFIATLQLVIFEIQTNDYTYSRSTCH